MGKRFDWLTRLFRPTGPRRGGNPPARTRLGVEALEARDCPSVTATFDLHTHTLTVHIDDRPGEKPLDHRTAIIPVADKSGGRDANGFYTDYFVFVEQGTDATHNKLREKVNTREVQRIIVIGNENDRVNVDAAEKPDLKKYRFANLLHFQRNVEIRGINKANVVGMSNLSPP